MGSMAYDCSLNTAPRALSESGGYTLGDMVWGAVRSHPWWPGQIYNEDLALPSVRASKLENHLLVAFFGDSSYGWLLPADLRPFAPHFSELSKQSRSRSFLNAVDDAVDEVCRRAALGLANTSSFGPSRLPGYVAVRVPGYEPCEYSVEQVEESRRRFVPGEVVECASALAVGPWREEVDSVDRIRLKATLLAYRRAMFKGIDVEAESSIEDDGEDLSSRKQQEQRKLPTSRPSQSKRSISDLTAIARRRRQSEELHPARPTAVANVVSGRSGGQAGKANAVNTKQKRPSAAVATGLEIPAELQSGNVLDSESPAKPEPGSVKNQGSNTRSNTMNSKKVQVPTPQLQNPKSQMVTTKRPLENPKSQMVATKRLKRERAPLETKPDSPPRKSISQAQQTHDEFSTAATINKTEAPAREASAELISRGSEDDNLTLSMLVESIVASVSSDEEEWTGATVVKSKSVSDRSDGEEQTDAKLVKSIPVSVSSEDEVVKSSPISLPSSNTDTSTKVPEFRFSQLLGDFRSLAIDHFYEADRNTPAIVKRAFGRFRSVVYRKSLRDQPPRRDVLPPSTAESGLSPVPSKVVMEIVVPETTGQKTLPEISTSREVGAELGPSPVPAKAVQEMGAPTKSLPDEHVHSPSIAAPTKSLPDEHVHSPSIAEAALPDEHVHSPSIAEAALSPVSLPAVPEINIPAIAGRKRVGSKQIKEPSAKRTKRLESPPQAVAPSKPKQLLEPGAKKDTDSLKSSQELDSRAKKDVVSALPALKRNPQLEAGAKKDVGTPVADAENEKDEGSVKSNQQLNPTNKKEEASPSPVASLKPTQQADSGSKALTQKKARTANPTYLIMTFPTGVKLPALPYIKTKFGGLGQIDASGTAVNLKTNSCRVLFKYKSDAESAFKYVESRQVFGEAKVEYRLKEAALPPRPPLMSQQRKQSPKTASAEAVTADPVTDATLPARQPTEASSATSQQRKPSPKNASPEAVTANPVADATMPARQPTELPRKPAVKVSQAETSLSEAIKIARAARQRVELEKKMASVKKMSVSAPLPGRELQKVAFGKEAVIAVEKVPASLPARELQKVAFGKEAAIAVEKVPLKKTSVSAPLPGGVGMSVSAGTRDVALPTRQASELEEVEASYKVALGDGTDVPVPARQPAELPKPCIRKAVEKAWATKEVRFSVGSSENVRPLSPPQGPKGVLASSPAAVASAVPLKVDISSQMMDLLLKCNEVVGAVKMSLGYVPYHTI